DLISFFNEDKTLSNIATKAGAFIVDPRLVDEEKIWYLTMLKKLKERFFLPDPTQAVVILFLDKAHNGLLLLHELTHVRQGIRGEIFKTVGLSMKEYVSSKQEVEAMLTSIIAFKYLYPF